ncbi:MAG TPA: DinB family protein [Candidatus Acidoferrum sp.]|jgi:uncharacterized damage-inducible protein DinB
MPNLQRTLEKLDRAQAELLRVADSIAPSEWNTPPHTDSWSAAHVIAHLCQVERGVVGYAGRVIRKAPFDIPYFQRFHVPLVVVEKRLIRRKSPIPVDTQLLADKKLMLDELRGIREETLAFLEETKSRNLSVYYWRHPFLGKLSFYNWFTFVAVHQVRHTKQIVEIAKNLPKRVVPS